MSQALTEQYKKIAKRLEELRDPMNEALAEYETMREALSNGEFSKERQAELKALKEKKDELIARWNELDVQLDELRQKEGMPKARKKGE